ncbi:MAG: flagellar export chaperone FliS [Rubrivivax sp.]|nr:flagellar export chaperone FliS [Rubrivivax sp.]
MFAASLFTPRRAAPSHAAAYQANALEIQVAGADAHRLVGLLFEGFEQAAVEAQGALASGDTELKCRALTRAIRIVDEGLRANLDLSAGGSLARDLLELYGYVVQRLSLANARNEAELIAECQRLIRPLHEAWLSIGNTPHAQR